MPRQRRGLRAHLGDNNNVALTISRPIHPQVSNHPQRPTPSQTPQNPCPRYTHIAQPHRISILKTANKVHGTFAQGCENVCGAASAVPPR